MVDIDLGWDEKAVDHAVAHYTNEHRPTLENINGYRRFATGARWQRDQLRSDEAVERVAIHMCATTMQESIWPKLSTDEQDEWRAEARAAINALLGEEK
ncbi:hypothetical protein [Brevibacterium sp. K72]|uniref:hypothetical protein n=1 Tax=Brevibacterium sp. K72 TaxID=3390729 RepID=UPI003D3015CA